MIGRTGLDATLSHLTRLMEEGASSLLVYDWARRVARGDGLSYLTAPRIAMAKCLRQALERTTVSPAPAAAETNASAGVMLQDGISTDIDDQAVMLGAACRALGIPTRLSLVSHKHGVSVLLQGQSEVGHWFDILGP